MNIRTHREIHRYLGLFVGVQLLLWTAGRLFFSLNLVARVRGETGAAEPPPLDIAAPLASPSTAVMKLVLVRPPEVQRPERQINQFLSLQNVKRQIGSPPGTSRRWWCCRHR